jgi:hypothetical protein
MGQCYDVFRSTLDGDKIVHSDCDARLESQKWKRGGGSRDIAMHVRFEFFLNAKIFGQIVYSHETWHYFSLPGVMREEVSEASHILVSHQVPSWCS